MINKIFTGIAATILIPVALHAQTLFTYGNKAVSQQEFTRAFEKNPSPGNRKKAMEEYLPLFINYKLKVQDALDKKMDTLPVQKSELDNYRSQLVQNYINSKSNTKVLVQEAFKRSQKDILLGHLFIGFTPGDSNSVNQALKQVNAAMKALENHQDFASVVRQYSTDEGNKASGGRVGWITVFSVPYVSESTIYALPVNGFSPVVKTSAGFHIFSNLAERPAAGTVKVAQIMLVNPDPGNRSIDEKNQRLADSLYDALQKGSRFDSLAYLFSNDRTSYSEGGVLQEFGVGTYSGKFEDVAFSLKKNEVSKPFKTEYGIHILKLLDAKPIPASMEDADFSAGLLEKVNATGRSQAAKNVFLKSQLQAFKFKPAPIAEKELFRFTDSSIGSGNIAGLPVTTKTPVFLMGTQTITANDWLNYIKTAKFLQSNENKSYTELLQAFYLAKTEEYIFRNIEKIDPPVKSQLKEFSDANLLFESMEMNVWNKAATDTAGLQAWYNNHKANYKWSESALAALVTCTDTSTLSAVLPALQNNPNAWHELADSYASSMFADSSRFELSQLPLGNETVKEGLVTAPVKNEQDGSYSFAVVFKKMPANEQRSFEDARGFVINDYQLLLEENWVKALRKKYPVTINQPVFAKLVKAPTK